MKCENCKKNFKKGEVKAYYYGKVVCAKCYRALKYGNGPTEWLEKYLK